MLEVETDRSSNGDIRPGLIRFGARSVVVLDVLDTWHGRDHRWWKVDTAEGQYILRHHHGSGTWELAAIVGETP